MTLYVIDNTADIKTQARAYSTMSAPEGHIPTHVDYTSRYNYNGANFTLQEYRDFKGNQNLVAITWEEFSKIIEAHEQTLQGEWMEETEDKYEYALECLPPCKWHNLNERFNSFYVSEALTGSLHSFHIFDRKTRKYYTATRSKFISDAELLTQLETL